MAYNVDVDGFLSIQPKKLIFPCTKENVKNYNKKKIHQAIKFPMVLSRNTFNEKVVFKKYVCFFFDSENKIINKMRNKKLAVFKSTHNSFKDAKTGIKNAS